MTFNEHIELNKKIADFAKEDKNREKLLKDPKGTIETYLNIVVPDDIEIVINENSQDTYHFTLPDKNIKAGGAW